MRLAVNVCKLPFVGKLTSVKKRTILHGVTYDELIAFYGTAANAAGKIGVSRPLLSMWKKRGEIPLGRQALIQIQTRGRLRADDQATVPQ